MKMLNLLSAMMLDKQLLIIIISLAAALLVAAAIIVPCVVHARKMRNENVVSQTNEEVDVKDDIVDNPEKHTDVLAEVVQNEPIKNESIVDEADVEEKTTEAELSELATAEDENAEDIDEEVSVQLDEQGNGSGGIVYRRTVYNYSFVARLTQAGDEIKQRYSDLKNYLLSYKKVKLANSWKRESFRFGRNTFACIVMRGKKLCLRFATDPKRFDDTKYKVIDMSIRSPKSKQPCMYRITSDRRVKYAKEIIDMLLTELSAEKLADYTEQNYVMPYRTTEALIEDNLIRVKVIEGVEPADGADSVKISQPVQAVVDAKDIPQRDFKILQKVEATEVNVMSDAEATKLIEYKVVKRKKSKGAKGIINIDVLSKKFPANSRITIDILRDNRIIPSNVNSIKVLAKGILDKPLIIEADDFSLQAVKMIALTGGRVIRTSDK